MAMKKSAMTKGKTKDMTSVPVKKSAKGASVQANAPGKSKGLTGKK